VIAASWTSIVIAAAAICAVWSRTARPGKRLVAGVAASIGTAGPLLLSTGGVSGAAFRWALLAIAGGSLVWSSMATVDADARAPRHVLSAAATCIAAAAWLPVWPSLDPEVLAVASGPALVVAAWIVYPAVHWVFVGHQQDEAAQVSEPKRTWALIGLLLFMAGAALVPALATLYDRLGASPSGAEAPLASPLTGLGLSALFAGGAGLVLRPWAGERSALPSARVAVAQWLSTAAGLAASTGYVCGIVDRVGTAGVPNAIVAVLSGCAALVAGFAAAEDLSGLFSFELLERNALESVAIASATAAVGLGALWLCLALFDGSELVSLGAASITLAVGVLGPACVVVGQAFPLFARLPSPQLSQNSAPLNVMQGRLLYGLLAVAGTWVPLVGWGHTTARDTSVGSDLAVFSLIAIIGVSLVPVMAAVLRNDAEHLARERIRLPVSLTGPEGEAANSRRVWMLERHIRRHRVSAYAMLAPFGLVLVPAIVTVLSRFRKGIELT